MTAHRHPKWLEEARRAEGGGVSDDDKMRSQHLNAMQGEASQGNQQGIGSHAMDNANKAYNTPLPGSYGDTINRANDSGADPADVQDVLQGAMHRSHGGRTRKRDGGGSVMGPETTADGDTSPMAVEEKGRSIPMSQKSAAQGSQMNSQAGQGTDQNKAFNTPYKGD